MTSVKPAVQSNFRSLEWTGQSLKLTEGPMPETGPIRSNNNMDASKGTASDLVTYEAVTEAMQSMRVDGAYMSAAAAYACAIDAHTLLTQSVRDYYTHLLYAARSVANAAPGNPHVSAALRRTLEAADRADGPLNGACRVAEAIEIEALRIHDGIRLRAAN